MANSEMDPGQGRPINILLVEDDEDDVEVTLRAFEKAKLRNVIQVVRDGQMCLDYMERKGPYTDESKYPRPDLILMDINMPRLSGFEVLEKLKAHSTFKSIPVIMLTSSRDENDIAMSFRGGAASYIQKPVSYEEFIKVVETFNFYWQSVNKLPGR